MKIAEMFSKPIDRDIKGVIKVGQDDGANVFQELDEYVVTRELSKHFREFFSSYKKGISGNTDKMGVWISGFFGSGKSHFLKILSYLLENREVNGKRAIDYFSEGNKISDGMVMADMKIAGTTSADVILFNIDSKSEADSKSKKDAILEVFVKVFNEMQGFCGALPFVADLERKLQDDNNYDTFKNKFKEINGSDWTASREDFYFIQDELVEVLASVGIMSEESARNWCEKASETYQMSIERFASLVKKYCEKKGKHHHIVFLVDEIGQYIGDDSKLMLNLQTLVEDMGRMCVGKVWIIVTSQQDIDSVTKVKGNDFSKIQGRFDTRLSLSSANVDEVIRKRILEKNDTAKDTLRLLYDQKETVIKNLLYFSDDSAEKKTYKDREDFANVYPFAPYQFDLLGQSLTAIRMHGASGKHLAEGERSMIALFKESAMTLMEKTEGALIPFNLFYNALHKFIDHTHSMVITKAYDNSNLEAFDVELLKVLFMIKYVKEIKANIENLTTLMASNIDDDRISIKKQVEEALDRLKHETLVQKNGDIYIFLTNEEQDINKLISRENITVADVVTEASAIIFEEILTEKKYRHSIRYNFAYNQIVDDRFYKNNQSADMGVKIITPYNEQEYTDHTLRMLSSNESNVFILMPPDPTFLNEITEALKINRFITVTSQGLPKSFDSIKRAKQEELINKKKNIKTFIEDALKHAEIYVNGDKASIGAKDPASRMNEAISKVVAVKYSKLTYMEASPTQSDIEGIFKHYQNGSFLKEEVVNANKLALDEVLQYIALNDMRNTKTSLKNIMDRFYSAPYGFIDLDVQWLVLMLFRIGKIGLILNSKGINLNNCEPAEIVKYVTKRDFAEKLLIEKREKPDTKQIKEARDVMKDLFGMNIISEDGDDLISAFHQKAKSKLVDIEKLLVEYRVSSNMPGKNVLEKANGLIEHAVNETNPMEFFRYIGKKYDEFVEISDEFRTVESFFAGDQKNIFKKSLKYSSIYENSKTYILDDELISYMEAIRGILKKENPYGEIFKLPDLNNKFAEKHLELLEKEAAPVLKELLNDKTSVLESLSSKPFADKLRDKFIALYDELKDKLETSNEIVVIKNIVQESDTLKSRCLNEISNYIFLYPPKPEVVIAGTHAKEPGEAVEVTKPEVVVQPKQVKNVTWRQITSGKIVELSSEKDVEQFLSKLREKLISELEEGKTIKLNL